MQFKRVLTASTHPGETLVWKPNPHSETPRDTRCVATSAQHNRFAVHTRGQLQVCEADSAQLCDRAARWHGSASHLEISPEHPASPGSALSRTEGFEAGNILTARNRAIPRRVLNLRAFSKVSTEKTGQTFCTRGVNVIGPSNQLRIAPPQHTRLEWLKKLEASGYACHYCGDSLTIHTATKDHKTPTCRGGSDRISNIVPSCLPCNQKKAWRTKAEFLRERDRLFNKPRVIRGIPNLKPSPAVAGISDEPGLLKKLTAERESVSWAWRNPAVQFIKLSDDDVADARAIIKAITGGKP